MVSRNSRGVATCYARDVINAIYKEGSQLRQGSVIEEHLASLLQPESLRAESRRTGPGTASNLGVHRPTDHQLGQVSRARFAGGPDIEPQRRRDHEHSRGHL